MKTKRMLSVLLVIVLVFCMTACAKNKNKSKEEQTVNLAGTISSDKKYTINLYYYDKSDYDMLSAIKTEFTKAYANINVELLYADTEKYIEKLVGKNDSENNMADVYLAKSEWLEQAYLSGITSDNNYDLYGEGTAYSKKAIEAGKYKGKMIAYPLYFNVPVLVCNKSFGLETPETFDKLKEYSDNVEVKEGQVLEYVFNWDISDLNINYSFIGHYAELGGETADDATRLGVLNDNVISGMNYYNELSTYFNINRTGSSHDKVIESFAAGHELYALISSDDIKLIKDKDTEGALSYTITAVPDMSADLKSSPMSNTTVLVVNQYSKNVSAAQLVAKYFSYDGAALIYENSGHFSTRKLEGNEFDSVYTAYEKSVLPMKFKDVGDFYLNLEIAFNKVKEGSDITTEVTALNEYITKQLK